MLGSHPHQELLNKSIEHHTSHATVHHFVYTEHNGNRGPIKHFTESIEVPERHVVAPRKPVVTTAKELSTHIGRMGKKSASAIAKPFRHAKESDRVHQVAHGYKAVDDFQKGITNRPII